MMPQWKFRLGLGAFWAMVFCIAFIWGCGDNHKPSYKVPSANTNTSNVEDWRIHSKSVEGNGHTYIVFTRLYKGYSISDPFAVTHDPDCTCHGKNKTHAIDN